MVSAPLPIGSVPRRDLNRLFEEEASRWRNDLSWNFGPTRVRLEAALNEGTLSGLAVVDDLAVCAYGTYALDGDHGIVGSVFAARRSRGKGLEARLMSRLLTDLQALRPRVIDCQTLFSSDPDLRTPFADRGFASATRLYMSIDKASWGAAQRNPSQARESRPIHRADLPAVSRLVYEAHRETLRFDASSSFDTLDSCQRVLRQIVLDEVCGRFDTRGSRQIEVNGRLLAVSLLTWPLPEAAHVSEVATSPMCRRQGLARQCVAETLRCAFDDGRASSVTLSVTATNHAALGLYESLGFAPRIRYQSHVLRDLGR